MHSLVYWFTDSLNHSCIDSLVHCFTESSIRWFIDSLNHGFTVAFSHCFLFTESWTHWFIDLLIHWFIDSSIRGFTGWLIHWFILHRFTDSSIYWLIASWIHFMIDSFSQLCMDFLMSFHWHLNHHLFIPWCTSQLQPPIVSASQKRSYGHWFLIAISYFGNFRPGACQILSGRWYIAIHKVGINGSPAYQCYH